MFRVHLWLLLYWHGGVRFVGQIVCSDVWWGVWIAEQDTGAVASHGGGGQGSSCHGSLPR